MDKDMLAENLENLVKKERLQGIEQGIQQGMQQGMQQGYQKAQAEAENRMAQAVTKMLHRGLSLDDVAECFDLSVEAVKAIQEKQRHH